MKILKWSSKQLTNKNNFKLIRGRSFRLILMAIAGLTIANYSAKALDDADGYRIIQKGDVVYLNQVGARMYSNKDDLLADLNVCGVYSFEQPQFQAMLKRFNDLKADDKAFYLHRHESATVLESEKFPLHGATRHIAQVKVDGLLLWIEASCIESDEDVSN
jgi:hypothetical protein